MLTYVAPFFWNRQLSASCDRRLNLITQVNSFFNHSQLDLHITSLFVNLDAILPNTTPLIRKYAFHMILAGHRFGKSGQKRHASRAYQLALQVLNTNLK